MRLGCSNFWNIPKKFKSIFIKGISQNKDDHQKLFYSEVIILNSLVTEISCFHFLFTSTLWLGKKKNELCWTKVYFSSTKLLFADVSGVGWPWVTLIIFLSRDIVKTLDLILFMLFLSSDRTCTRFSSASAFELQEHVKN